MFNKRQYPDLLTGLGLFAAMAVVVTMVAPYRIGFKEQIGIFYWSTDRIAWYLSNPAVLASIIGDWLTQFYYYNTTGIIVTLCLLAVLWIGMAFLTRLAGADKPAYTVSVLPVIMAGAFIVWPNYPVSAVVGLIFSIWAACLVGHIKNASLRSLVIGIGIPLLFILAGGHSVTFALACFFLKNGRIRSNLILTAIGITVLFILARLYNLSIESALLYPAVPDYVLPATRIILLLPLSIVVVLAASFLKNILIPGVISLICSVLILFTFDSEILEFSVKVGTLAYRSQWKEVKEVASKKTETSYGLFYRNLSYAREGRLPDELLKCRQSVLSDGLFLSTKQGDPYFSMIYYTDALLEMGDLSQATDCALLAQTVLPGYNSTRLLRRLAEISVTAGDYEVADKYLNVLSRTRNHKDWAENLMKCIQKDSIPEQYLIWRYRSSGRDVFFGIGDIRASLRAIADNSPTNRVAIDYLLCSCLLEKNVGSFRNYYEKYWLDGLDRIAAIPDLYQEVLLLFADSDESLKEIVEKYHISDRVVSRYAKFMGIQLNPENSSDWVSEFNDTYWYYIMAVDLSGVKHR